MQQPTITQLPTPTPTLQPRLFQLHLLSLTCPFRTILSVLTSENTYTELISTLEFPSNRQELTFKILTFSDKVKEEIRRVRVPNEKEFGRFEMEMEGGGRVVMQSRVVNQARGEGRQVMTVRVGQVSNYEKFLEFRRKVKRLENLTSPLNWQLSHRLSITQGSQTFQFSLVDTHPITLPSSSSQVTISLIQLSSLTSQNHLQQPISESIIAPTPAEFILKFSQYLEIKIVLEKLVAEFKPEKGLMSVRVLEAEEGVKVVSVGEWVAGKEGGIGTGGGALQEVGSRKGKVYFDPEYWYLEGNLGEVEGMGESEALQQLDKLTKAFPEYPHIKNQQLIPIHPTSKGLLLSLTSPKGQSQHMSIQLPNLLPGLNSILPPNSTTPIRFYLEHLKLPSTLVQLKSKRTFSVYPQTLWNCYSLFQFSNLTLKLRSNKTMIQIQLKVSGKDFTTGDAQMRRQVQKLQIQEQVGVDYKGKRFIMGRGEGKNETRVMELPNMPEPEGYVFQEVLFEQNFHVEVCVNDEIVAFGAVQMKDWGADGKVIVPMQNGIQGKSGEHMFAIFRCVERQPTHSNSANTLYRFAYQLSTSQPLPYDLQLTPLNPTTTNSSTPKSHLLRLPPTNSLTPLDLCLLTPTPSLRLSLTLKRRYFQQLTNSYSYRQYLSKQLSVNSDGHIGQWLNVSENCYEVIEWEFYEETKVVLRLQVMMQKEEALDVRGQWGVAVKIPQVLWGKVKEGFGVGGEVQVEVVSGKRSKGNRVLPKKKELGFLDSRELVLGMVDYRDSLSVCIDGKYGYSKLYDLVKLPVSISSNQIDLNGQSNYSLCFLNIHSQQFLFLLRYQTTEQCRSSSSSQHSARTTSKSPGTAHPHNTDLQKTTRFGQLHVIKQHINQTTDENRKLLAKVVRLENTNTMLEQKLQSIKEIAERSKEELKFTNKYPVNSKFVDPQVKERREREKRLYREVCGCGKRNPQFMGYCEDCLKELEKSYRIIYKKFEEKAKVYEDVYFRNVIKKQKISILQAKLKNMKDRLLMRQTQQLTAKQDQQSINQSVIRDLTEQISILKNNIFTIKIKTQNIIECSNELQKGLENKINTCNRNIFSTMQEIEMCKRELALLEEKMKERFG